RCRKTYEKENLCLYGIPNETWEVNLSVEEVPLELPDPALGINFARDGIQEKDWLSLVAVHRDSWMLSVAVYFGARFGFCKSARTCKFPPLEDREKSMAFFAGLDFFGGGILTKEEIGGLVVVDGPSGDRAVGSGSGAAIGAIDAPLTVFKTNHYEYDHIGYTNFASPSECSACKCQDCRAKHDVVINVINALTASVKELTSKRGVIPSKRILFSSTPLEINAKRRKKLISKALSSIQKRKIATPLSMCCTKQYTMSKGEQHKPKKSNIYVF
ncbi:PHD finger protein ALFIN-LIKE 4, partial [Capsicum annuum]